LKKKKEKQKKQAKHKHKHKQQNTMHQHLKAGNNLETTQEEDFLATSMQEEEGLSKSCWEELLETEDPQQKKKKNKNKKICRTTVAAEAAVAKEEEKEATTDCCRSLSAMITICVRSSPRLLVLVLLGVCLSLFFFSFPFLFRVWVSFSGALKKSRLALLPRPVLEGALRLCKDWELQEKFLKDWKEKTKQTMMMMMVSDADIVRRLTSVLKTADLATTTTAAIRQHLENELGVDLSDKKAFIRQQVDLYLQQQVQEDKEKEEEEEAQGEEEEEEQQEEHEQLQQQQDEVDDYGKQTVTTGSDSKQRLLAKIGRSSSKERYNNL
jgi:hypothetical protein